MSKLEGVRFGGPEHAKSHNKHPVLARTTIRWADLASLDEILLFLEGGVSRSTPTR